jgi:hypothetical protein
LGKEGGRGKKKWAAPPVYNPCGLSTDTRTHQCTHETRPYIHPSQTIWEASTATVSIKNTRKGKGKGGPIGSPYEARSSQVQQEDISFSMCSQPQLGSFDTDTYHHHHHSYSNEKDPQRISKHVMVNIDKVNTRACRFQSLPISDESNFIFFHLYHIIIFIACEKSPVHMTQNILSMHAEHDATNPFLSNKWYVCGCNALTREFVHQTFI